MASLDFDKEKNNFREYYSDNIKILDGAVDSFRTLISALLNHDENIYVSKVEGRIKEKEECIKKFNVKYRKKLEGSETEYSIKDHITDLIGLRVVCLYEDDIEKIREVLKKHFEVIDETNKISQIESTADSFGYKGLHLDLKLGEERKEMPEYKSFVGLPFEIQIRTIIQDSWSVLDHKIKYKKSIPNPLKRRINTLAALFELADREFKEIRISTEEELRKAEQDDNEHHNEIVIDPEIGQNSKITNETGKLNAFGFLKIAKHFFKDYDFEDFKVDGFTEEIVSLEPTITRTKFNQYMRETVSKVKTYKQHFEETSAEGENQNPFTIIRHCLYLNDREKFSSLLTNIARESFDKWIEENL